jgi:multidrug efflux pump subunit AcrA (membrane-fusion protein)
LPDETEATGVIVGVTAKPAETPDEAAALAVEITCSDDVLAGQSPGSSARVTFTDTIAAAVLTVPVTALVAFAEGGYAVAKLDDDGPPLYVPVQVGRFAGTAVELSGGAIVPGDRVAVMP